MINSIRPRRAPISPRRAAFAALLTATLLPGVFIAPQASAAVQYVVDGNGKMTHALNVAVGGESYNVEFRDGIFNQIFGEQNQLAFVAASAAEGQLFSQALLDQVLVGQYDDYAYYTNGCEHLGYCLVSTPYLSPPLNTPYPGFAVSQAYNEGLEGGNVPPNDLIFDGAVHRLNDYANNPAVTYAIWSVAEVPLPAAGWLFGGAVLGLAGMRRKR